MWGCYVNKHVEWGVLFSCFVVNAGHGVLFIRRFCGIACLSNHMPQMSKRLRKKLKKDLFISKLSEIVIIGCIMD